MFRCDNHECDTEKCIRTCCINAETLLFIIQFEVHKCTCGFADPVLLLLFDIVRVIHFVQTFKQFVCILGDAKIPYFLGLLDNITVADITFAALAVFVGKDNLTGWTVVNQSLVTVSKTIFEKLQENPLCPFVVVFLCCINDTIPVKGEAHTLHLIGKTFNILIGNNSWMCVGLYGVVLSRKAEGIKTDREKNIISLHTTLTGYNFKT